MESEKVQAAYDQMAYRVVEPTNDLALPTSTSASFDYNESGGNDLTADRVHNALEKSVTLIDENLTEAHDGYFKLSSKIFISETNEFLHIKAASSGISLYPKDDDYSKEAVKVVLEALESELDVELVLRDEEPEPSE